MVEIIKNYEIKNESTFRIGGVVDEVAMPETTEELIELLNQEKYDYVLGNCSNILFSSNRINKKIILTKKLTNYEIIETRIKVSCGTKGPIISKECAKLGLTGFEFLIGFPGSFGGMICMNASAHNQSIADTFVSARVYNLKTKKIEELSKEQMGFNYRKTNISNGNYIVIDAIFELKKAEKVIIEEFMQRNTDFRKERQPSLQYGNAGSTFKNPQNDSAGRLLDLCGLKGVSEGGAKVFDKHANFVINYNNATSSDVINLMYKMHLKVIEKYRISLIPEILYIGNEGTKEYKLWQIMTENIN